MLGVADMWRNHVQPWIWDTREGDREKRANEALIRAVKISLILAPIAIVVFNSSLAVKEGYKWSFLSADSHEFIKKLYIPASLFSLTVGFLGFSNLFQYYHLNEQAYQEKKKPI